VWVTSAGDVTDGPVAVPAVADVSPDGSLVAGLDSTADDDIHVCGGVYDVGVGDHLWRDCEDNAYDFSPDGALVATSFSEGLGPTGVRIRDAHSGAPVAELNGSLVTSYTWEDVRHLLVVVVEEDGSVSLQRFGSGGAPETVLDGLHTDDPTTDMPVVLPES
jgi:hypothetical protein